MDPDCVSYYYYRNLEDAFIVYIDKIRRKSEHFPFLFIFMTLSEIFILNTLMFPISIFLVAGGDSSGGRQTRNGVAVCSQKRALCVTAIVLAALLGTALVIAYAGPQNGKHP